MICIGMTLLVCGCKKNDTSSTPATPAPVANFTYTGAGSFAPSTVQFTSTSSDATTYSWDFGDNGTSTEQNPSHLFTLGGTYTVRLIATGAGGSNSITKTINILNAPTQVKITSISVTEYAEWNGSVGTYYDNSADGLYPDLVITIADGSSTLYTSFPIMNAQYSQRPFIYTLSSPINLPNLSEIYYISLYDDDSSFGLWDMGYALLQPSSLQAYPTSYNISYLGTAFTVNLQWQ